MSRADKRTRTEVMEELYSDFTINFDRNPITGVLARSTNDDAVKRSLRQIVLVTREEWPHHPNLGSKIYHLLFEPLEISTALMLKDAIQHACTKEPRAQVLDITVEPLHQEDGYRVTIPFHTINSTEIQTLTEILKRVR